MLVKERQGEDKAKEMPQFERIPQMSAQPVAGDYRSMLHYSYRNVDCCCKNLNPPVRAGMPADDFLHGTEEFCRAPSIPISEIPDVWSQSLAGKTTLKRVFTSSFYVLNRLGVLLEALRKVFGNNLSRRRRASIFVLWLHHLGKPLEPELVAKARRAVGSAYTDSELQGLLESFSKAIGYVP